MKGYRESIFENWDLELLFLKILRIVEIRELNVHENNDNNESFVNCVPHAKIGMYQKTIHLSTLYEMYDTALVAVYCQVTIWE